MPVEIYESEADIADAINDSLVAHLYAKSRIRENLGNISVKADLEELVKKEHAPVVEQVLAAITPDKHPELMYGSAILASTVWNGNDDIFLPSEMWAARFTPIHQQFDQNHKRTNIIGHIVAARCLDEDGKEVDSGGNEPPNFFGMEVDWVVYQYIFPDIAKEIREKGPDGDMSVSMEARMKNFDYGLLDDNNDFHVVARNKDTAFLTKHLRIYKGTGEYKGKRIGRVLRNFVFNGMGNVTVPANERSLYTKLDGKVLTETSQASSFIDSECINQSNRAIFVVPDLVEHGNFNGQKGNGMKIENLEQALAHIATLTQQVEVLKSAQTQKAVEDLEGQVKASKDEVVQAQKATKEANDKVTSLDTQLQAAKNAQTEAEKQLVEIKTKLETANADLKKIADEKAKAEAAKLGTDRLTEMKGLGLTYKDEAAQATKFATMSVEAYAEMVESVKQVKAAQDTAKAEADKAAKEKAEKDAQAAAQNPAGAKADAEAQAKAALEAAEKNKETEVPAGDAGQTVASVIAKAFKSRHRKIEFKKD